MDGLCQVIINPLPQIFLLTALNGETLQPGNIGVKWFGSRN